jgi:sodium-coupled monocarboxylate transporter 8/12
MMMPIFIINHLPHGIIGLLIVAILSAAMSYLNSTINSLAAVTVEDYCRLTNKEPDDDKYLGYAKYTSVVWGIVTLLLSLYAGDIADTVIEAINKVGSVFYGPILSVFLLAIFDKRLNALQVNIGLLSGVAFNVFLWLSVPDVFWFWWNLIGAIMTTIVAYGSLLFTKEKRTAYQPTPSSNADREPILNNKDKEYFPHYLASCIKYCKIKGQKVRGRILLIQKQGICTPNNIGSLPKKTKTTH